MLLERDCAASGGSRMSEVVVTSLSNLQNEVSYGVDHTFITDEPPEAGGEDAGPDPTRCCSLRLGVASQ